MNRRTFVTLGAGVAGASLAGTRLGFPRYRVTLWGLGTGERVGEWEVSAIERAPDVWREHMDGPERHLWIDPLQGNGWDEPVEYRHERGHWAADIEATRAKYPGEGAYAIGRVRVRGHTRDAVCVWGHTPWDADARSLVVAHDGLGVTWERVA